MRHNFAWATSKQERRRIAWALAGLGVASFWVLVVVVTVAVAGCGYVCEHFGPMWSGQNTATTWEDQVGREKQAEREHD